MKNAKIKEVSVISVSVRKKFVTAVNGMTLIELVIGMVLIGIVALVVANALSTGITGFFVVDNRKEALDQARIAMDRMAKEIRNVRSISDITLADANTFTFNDTSGTPISFALSGGNITRTPGGTLATRISSSTFFSYVKTDGSAAATTAEIKRIAINFTATAGSAGSEESITLQTEVWPRNL